MWKVVLNMAKPTSSMRHQILLNEIVKNLSNSRDSYVEMSLLLHEKLFELQSQKKLLIEEAAENFIKKVR